MEATSEAPIQTTVFIIDRASYCRARVLDLLSKIWIWVGLGVLASLVGWAVTSQDEPIHSYFAIALFGLPGFVIFALIVLVAKIWSPGNRHLFERPRSFLLTPDQIAFSLGELGEAKYSWKLITRIAKTSNWTFLFQQQLLVVAIPNSCLAPEDLPRFRDLIRSKKQMTKQA
jgi:hypothetical protein